MPQNTSGTKRQKPKQDYYMTYIAVYNLAKNTVEERFRFVGTQKKLIERIDDIAETYKISERCGTSYIAQLFIKSSGIFSLYDIDSKGKPKNTYYLGINSLPVTFIG